ncbi:unnamed protein product [Rotaria sordida]|uniref:Potassium channel tetramerisation-type BTB domain-containing protein n=1 Tax=Rotaria sordida TaxID=392033 RepID=A0A819P406_9BILA|nr:unnamed protein product [Rotaria sordida]
MYNSSSSDDDVIELNVSGERISTLRSTLTAIPNSKLALMFTKDNRNVWQLKDKEDVVFFDYNPVQFKYLLDQLRMIKRTPDISPDDITFQAPQGDIQTNFSYMIADLGLNACNSRKLLVACRPANNNKMLTLAGIGKWKDLFRPCSSNTHCQIEIKNDIGFYYVQDQAWGFEGHSQINLS